jgi:hypothetical protein
MACPTSNGCIADARARGISSSRLNSSRLPITPQIGQKLQQPLAVEAGHQLTAPMRATIAP